MLPEQTTVQQESHTIENAPRPVTSAGPPLRQALDPKVALLEERGFASRYVAQDLLGTGGMGEVRLHRDARIGRGVAMKMIRADKDAGPNVQARFLREARVQGQLEHPSIVPVYDVGVGPDGVLYFTMKRVHGLTFADIFTRLRAHDAAAESEFSLRKLLAAFGSVCLAIEFAHTRSVVHRDLKPSNVMLGHFGEVYVLDWGVAKILEEDDDVPRSTRATGEGDDISDSSERNGVTAQGDFVGTPGFFSPEQLDNSAVDGRSDVYALGAILFQMLTLIPLHKGKLRQIMLTTKSGVDARCSVRAPDRPVPPELEEICVKATRTDPASRFSSARELHDAVQKYLDGDRDLERRRALAIEHAKVAMTALEAAKADPANGIPNRAHALSELGRSVALDPSNEVALGGIVSLLLEPPRELPEEVKIKMSATRASSMRRIARAGAVAFSGGTLVNLLFLLVMGVKEWRWFGGFMCFMAIAIGTCLLQARRMTPYLSYAVVGSAFLAYFCMTRVFGPFVLIPSFAMSTATVYAMHPDKRVHRWAMIAMTLVILLPVALESLHVLSPSYVFTDGHLVIVSRLAELPALPTLAFLGVMTILLLFIAGGIVRRMGNALTDAEEKLAVQAWQFRQLVPERARDRVKLEGLLDWHHG